MDCTYTGGLKNASSVAVITFGIAFFFFFNYFIRQGLYIIPEGICLYSPASLSVVSGTRLQHSSLTAKSP